MAGYIGANTSSVTNNQNAAERRKKFTFTANTTALTGLSFLPNKIHIFHNGIRLVKDTDFLEAADGQSVTLINAAQAGDEVVAVTFEQNPSINTGSAYGDTDVDAHLLTAGVTLDATNDRVGIGSGATSPEELLEVNKASANTRVRVHSSTNSTPSAGIELMRGTNTTFGADAYTDFRIENINGGHLAISTGESGTITEQFRVNSNGHVTKPNQPAFYMRNTADGTRYKGGTVYVNKSNSWNNTTGVFTTPVAGAYQFGAFGQSNAGTFYVLAYKNGSAISAWYDSAGSGYKHASLTIILDMAVNDTLYIQGANINTGGQNGMFGHFLG